MNRSYRLVWNAITWRHVPAPETAHGRGNGRPALALAPMALLLGALLAPPAGAGPLPSGGRVVHGTASIGIDKAGRQMTIDQTSHKAILHWQGFDIGHGAKVQFNQPGASAIALNRVVGGKASRIDGQLRANGQVWLVNPNGVVFGNGSQVNVGGLIASTLDISDENFEAGKQIFTRGAATGGITNHGEITATGNDGQGGGLVALLAPTVCNEGVIRAHLGDVMLAGGNEVTLQAGADGRLMMAVDQATVHTLIENRRMIMADGGQVLMVACAADALAAGVVSNTGTVQAHTLAQRQGRILLLGGHALHGGGLLDASAPEGGNGGRVLTSAARVHVAPGAKVTTAAARGQTGKWVIDQPGDLRIGTPGTGPGIAASTLAANLGHTDIGLRAGASVDVTGDIRYGRNRLALDAQGDIHIRSRLSVEGDATLQLNYGGTAGHAGAPAADGSNLYVHGRVDFARTGADLLQVNGQRYTVLGSAQELQSIGNPAALGGHYALGRSIDAGSVADFEPIGSFENAFRGTFDGLGHAIRNLHIRRPERDGVGLFGHAENATLRNVRLAGGSVEGYMSVGGLVGSQLAEGGTASISNASNSGRVSGEMLVGGLVGHQNAKRGQARISNVLATGPVAGDLNVGGLVGSNQAALGTASIIDADAGGQVSGSGSVGGLVGTNQAAGSALALIRNARATGQVRGGANAGGLVGSNQGESAHGRARISHAHATGQVSGSDHVGGLVGESRAVSGIASIDNSLATGQVTGYAAVGGLVGSAAACRGTSSISASQASGQVRGGDSAGGLVGLHQVSEGGNAGISSARAIGQVSATRHVGGLVGSSQNLGGTSSIVQARADGNVWGIGSNAGGLVGFDGTLPLVSVNTLSHVRASGNVAGRISVGRLVGGLDEGQLQGNGTTRLVNAIATGAVVSSMGSPRPQGW